jgi:glycosyltransferase involved in cell wall biosynthesis
MKSIAIIPAYNEDQIIGEVVSQTLQYVDSVIVINDQSTDDTVNEAIFTGATVKFTKGNRGAGKATRQGILLALVYGADAVVTLDGDGQHNPGDIPQMLKLLERFDIVLASRFMDIPTNIPAYRRFGVKVITFAYNFGYGYKISDAQCGLRAFRSTVFENIEIEEDGFGFSTETLIKARSKGFKITEMPTTVKYHKEFRQNSTLNPIKHGLSVLFCTLKWRFKIETKS